MIKNYAFIFSLFSLLLASEGLAQTQKISLLEHFTNTRCINCPTGNRALFATLDSLDDEVLHIAYHSRTPYSNCVFYQHNTTQANARRDRYNVAYTPQAMLNGTFNGGGTSILSVSEAQQAAAMPSPLGIEVQSRWSPSDSFEVGVNVHFLQNLPGGNYALFVAIVEKNIDYNAPNGEDKHRNVFRAMLPNDDGEALPMLSANTSTGFYTYKIAKHPDWVQNEIQAIAFVQNLDNDEVINAGTDGSFSTGIESDMDPGIAIAPNPATDRVRIGWSADIPQADIQLLDLQGRTVLSVNKATPGHELDLGTLSKGIYLLQLQHEGKRWSRKLVVN